MSEIDISIIIVNYNVKDFLLQALRSIETAKDKLNIETIVIDNDSKDGSVDFLRPLFPKVEFVALDENVGFGRANNVGIKKARGKYILILNPDVILKEDTLRSMFDYMEARPQVGVSGCKTLNPDGTFQLACRRGFPTPWASFSKLFGLQSLFPKSKLFAQYNQTFRSVDETYYIDAVIGAFMFCRREALLEADGFDPDFFMYGEDLDLCWRVKQNGWKIAYVHSTSIIHFKGESSKRGDFDRLKHFYKAMEIFAKKRYSSSSLFLAFLRLGIFFRSTIAYGRKYWQHIFIAAADLLTINFAFLIGTKLRFDEYFRFPDYAYPTVFIALTITLLASMTAVGSYFDHKRSLRRSSFALMISFFFLSSLTYFFKEYAFSRGVLLMTIGFTLVESLAVRAALTLFDRVAGSGADRRIGIVGSGERAEKIVESIRAKESWNANIVGFVDSAGNDARAPSNLPLLGSIENIGEIIARNKLQEIIVCDPAFTVGDLLATLEKTQISSARFHIANEYEELLASRIIDEISGYDPPHLRYNIAELRYKLAKRIIDVFLSVFLLTIGIPVLYLLAFEPAEKIKAISRVLKGELSLIGPSEIDGKPPKAGKPGLIGPASISPEGSLSKFAVEKLNEYYIQHYSLSLDLDILIKYIIRKQWR